MLNVTAAVFTFLTALCISTLLAHSSASAGPTKERITLMLAGSHCRETYQALETALRHTDGVFAVDDNSVPGHLLIDVEEGKTSASDLLEVVQATLDTPLSCRAEIMRSCVTAPRLARVNSPVKQE